MNPVELLSPAGNLEKLKIAFTYGADAVFVGTPFFGLRKHAPNFTLDELRDGINYAHKIQKKVYIVLNSFAHQSDLLELESIIMTLADLNPDAFIISDVGVALVVKRLCSVPIHVSTQASVTNAYACRYWKDIGAKRIILAREVSISECRSILNDIDIELETFVHGSMCASYSGKCVISNYTAARDSNRGGCVQSCRHRFTIQSTQSDHSEGEFTLMNAKDLMAIPHIGDMIDAGISSFKIEGRMKSNLYVATVTLMYRRAIDAYLSNSPISISELIDSLSKVSNRTFNSGFLDKRLFSSSVNDQFSEYSKGISFLGTIKESSDEWAFFHIKSPFKLTDKLSILTPCGNSISIRPDQFVNLNGQLIDVIRPNMMLKSNSINSLPPHSILYST